MQFMATLAQLLMKSKHWHGPFGGNAGLVKMVEFGTLLHIWVKHQLL